MSPETFLYGLLLTIWVEDAWHYYLIFRQRNVFKESVTLPHELKGIMPVETFNKARLYNIDLINLGIVSSLFGSFAQTVVILGSFVPLFWKQSIFLAGPPGFLGREIIASVIFMIIATSVNSIVSIPFQIYSTFVIEERYGFNKQTFMFFVKDGVKAFILVQALVLIFIGPMVYIIKTGGQYFFIHVWLFTMFVTSFFLTIYPYIIAPYFDTYIPLEDGELKTSIENLASAVNFPLTKINVIEGSKRFKPSNVYFYGFFEKKRIVLFDTLLAGRKECSTRKTPNSTSDVVKKEGLSNNEILALIAHELGHWKENHDEKRLIMAQINTFILFMVFGYLFQHDIIYKAFGFDSQPVVVGVYVIFHFIFSPYHFISSFLLTSWSRKYEFKADDFARSLGKTDYLASALVKINKDDLGFPVDDWLYSMFFHPNPPLLERLIMLNKSQ